MGVRGLQSFLKENRQSLCRSLVLDASGADARERVPVVVDAWGIIYQLYLDALPWASGGEYFQFYRLVRRLVRAWRAVGLEPVFVFDGASPPEKHATLLSRMQQSVETSRLFYTTRPESRSSPSGQRGGQTILPPFTSQTFAAALAALDVDTRFVPRGEADGECVVLAARLGGYVMGRDTDFIILASGAEAMKGYIPLDMIEWTDSAPAQHDAKGEEFTTVSSGKRRPHRSERRVSRLLPGRLRNPTLVLPVFTSSALGRRLRLTANMLPLLASLVGNDYSSGTDNNGGKPADRIDRIARTLRETQARPGAHGADTAYELVSRVVRKLHVRPYVDERELAATVDAVVDATIQYVLPSPRCCQVYPFCGELETGCASAVSRSTDVSRACTPGPGPATSGEPKSAASAYAAAQARGHLNLVTHAWLHPDRVYLWGVLENPSGPSARAGPLPTAVRRAAYTVIDEALGLRWPQISEEERDARRQDREAASLLAGLSLESKNEEEEEEAVTVEWSNADTPTSEATSEDDADSGSTNETPRHVVVEYLRQGSSTRIGSRELELPPPSTSSPICLQSLEARLEAYRTALDAPVSIAALPPSLQPLACALRLCVLSAAESDPSGRGGRWRRAEVEAVARAAIGCLEGWAGTDEDEDEDEDAASEAPEARSGGIEGAEGEAQDSDVVSITTTTTGEDNYPLLTNRAAELVAQFSAALLDTMCLAQALLLGPPARGAPPSVENIMKEGLTHLTPYAFISGSALHSLLAGNEPQSTSGWRWSATWKHRLHRTLAAVLDGVEDSLAPDFSSPKRKKGKKPSGGGARGGGEGGGGRGGGGGGGGGAGRFHLLMEEEM